MRTSKIAPLLFSAITATALANPPSDPVPHADPMGELSACVIDALNNSGNATVASLKSVCEQQYMAVQNSLPENVRAGTMASVDAMLAQRVQAISSGPN